MDNPNLLNVFHSRNKITVLKRQFEILVEQHRSVELEIEIRSLEGDDGQAIKTWNDRLNEVEREAQQFLERENASSYSCSCFFTRCPNPKVRWRLGLRAQHITKDIVELLREKGMYGNIRSHHKVPVVPEARNEYNPPSRTKIYDKILNLLKYSDEQFIGCHGMGGVGKTKLVKEVWRLAGQARKTRNMADAGKRTPLNGSGIHDDKLFDKVIVVNISESPVITKIQEQIAEGLGISLRVNNEYERAFRLCYALNKKNTKVLIIFDDIWDELDMRRVGVPCGKGVPGPKILLTSRNLASLEGTGSRVNNIKLDDLSPFEAERLFESSVGEVEHKKLAELILEKCGGYPLSIFVAAGIVRGKGMPIWKDAVNQLRRIDNKDFVTKVYSVLGLSIQRASNEEKDLLLLCCILGEHRIPVLNLLMYCTGLRMFKSMNSLETAWNRLHSLINDLIDRSLLIGFDETHQCVKIHDMVRLTAARLANGTNKTFTPQSDKLERWPIIQNNATTISLPYAAAVDEIPDNLEFSDLEFFLYHPEDMKRQDVGSDLRISNSFFAQCKQLKVLSLKGISADLASVGYLENLRTLCLHRCYLSESGFPWVKELKNLEVLSLRESDLTCLPVEVEMLTRLKLLELHGCKDLEVIPATLLSKLSKLEHLYMRNTDKFSWNRERSASLSELELMKCLTCIEIEIERGMEMPRNVDYEKLERFYIDQGIKFNIERNYECKILLQSLPCGKKGNSDTLLERADFIYLKEVICQEKVLFESHGFDNLTELYIDHCNRMQYLFSLSVANSLINLRNLTVANSDAIEGIVYIHEAYDRKNANLKVKFPNLVRLKLVELPSFRNFVNSSNVSGDCQHSFFGRELSLSELEVVELEKLPKMESIWGDNLLSCSLYKIKSITIKDCSLLVTLFSCPVSLSELEVVELEKLPKMKSIWGDNLLPCSLHKIKSITIKDCSLLVTLISSSVCLSELEVVVLEKLPLMESIWGDNLMEGSLCKIKSIIIKDCSLPLMRGMLFY